MSSSEEQIARATAAYGQGRSVVLIAADLGMSKVEARRLLVDAGVAIRRRGFAAMDAEKQDRLAALGGAAVPARSRAYSRNRKLASTAGSKGGMSLHHGVADAGHGLSPTAGYHIWKGMMARCYHPQDVGYRNYGGRGIQVCERWRTPQNFLDDMGERPPGMSIERIDNDLGYCPDNCRWATHAEQSANKRTTRFITALGQRRKLLEWASLTGIARATIASRLANGWPADEAVTIPVIPKGRLNGTGGHR